MALSDAVRALRQNWAGIVAGLEPTLRHEVAARAEDLRQAPGRVRRRVLARTIVELLRGHLPPGHPVLVAATQEADMASVPVDLDVEIDQLRSLFAAVEADLGATPEEIARQAHTRILAAGTRTAAEARGAGQDPDEPGLIRLPVHGGGDRLPTFQFGTDGRTLPVVLAVNALLEADRDPWGVASWWLRGNGWLAAVPASLIGQVPDGDLIAAAVVELEDD
jgi:hypothetical protein